MRSILQLGLVLGSTALAVAAPLPPAPDVKPVRPDPGAPLALIGREPLEQYVTAIEQWRAGRLQRLTGPAGWLALIGRHPLEPGTWSIGSAAGNGIRFAAGPANLGTLTCAASGQVKFSLAPDVEGTIDGAIGRTAVLVHHGETPTYVRSGTINFYILESGGKLFVRVRDSESARRRNFTGIESYPIDPAWRIVADWVPFDPPHTLRITNVLGLTEDAPCPGKAVFRYQDRNWELLPVIEEGDNRLFFIITDATAGTETYEASRFFYAEMPQDGKVVLDFNKVYNPPCAFTPFTTCPLPPKENVLPFALRAGEKKYLGPH